MEVTKKVQGRYQKISILLSNLKFFRTYVNFWN